MYIPSVLAGPSHLVHGSIYTMYIPSMLAGLSHLVHGSVYIQRIYQACLLGHHTLYMDLYIYNVYTKRAHWAVTPCGVLLHQVGIPTFNSPNYLI